MELTLGYSPCPNDTFLFDALVHGRIDTRGYGFKVRLDDVETLNEGALYGRLDVTKVSFHALGHVRDRYVLLRSGAALGRGCGPLLVSRDRTGLEELRGKSIAIPGHLTTAALLLRLAAPELWKTAVPMPFDRIIGAVGTGEVQAGLIIHESRFTYQAAGLMEIIDLGAWWEEETGLPIPLGGIAARRDLGRETIETLEGLIRESLKYARRDREASRSYVKEHAQETDDGVILSHIDLYVTDFTERLGPEGESAVRELLRRGEAGGVFPRSGHPLYPG
jgi:1,4-dihydroxy-6-naphthoate synthase